MKEGRGRYMTKKRMNKGDGKETLHKGGKEIKGASLCDVWD
jgi:hypothetical protein